MTITAEDFCQGVCGVYHIYLYENGIVEAADLSFYAAEEENVMMAFRSRKCINFGSNWPSKLVSRKYLRLIISSV